MRVDYHKHKAIEQGLANFFQLCHSRTYPAKSIIIRPGDPATTLYYLREGSVSISMENEDGEELTIAYLYQGAFLGDSGFFTGIADKQLIVRARSTCRTEEISYQQIRALADKQLKECYPTLLQLLAEQMARRLHSATRKLTDMVFLDVAGRVESALRELAEQPDAIRHPLGVQIKVTRQEISRIVGCSREMAGRVLKDLQAADVLWAHGKTVVIYPHNGND